MPTEWKPLLDLLLGPVGLTVGALFVVWMLGTGRWIPKERLDEMRTSRDDAIKLLDKSLDGYDAQTRAIEERNRMERTLVEERRGTPGLRAEAEEAQRVIRKRRET